MKNVLFNGLYDDEEKILNLFDEGRKLYDAHIQVLTEEEALDISQYLTDLCVGHSCSGCYQRIIGDSRIEKSCVPNNNRDLFAEYFAGKMIENELLGGLNTPEELFSEYGLLVEFEFNYPSKSLEELLLEE